MFSEAIKMYVESSPVWKNIKESQAKKLMELNKYKLKAGQVPYTKIEYISGKTHKIVEFEGRK